MIGWNFRVDGGSYHRLYYNFDAGSTVRFGDDVIALTPDRVVFIPAGSRFFARSENPTRHCYLEFVQTPLSQRLTEVQVIAAQPHYAKLFGEFHRVVSLADEGGALCLALAILHIAAVDLQLRWRVLPQEFNTLLTLIPRNRFRDTDSSLAARLGFSPQRFRRWFASHMDMTPAQYIRRAQLAEAGKLLRVSEIPIEQIAEESGFPNRFYFTRAFTREMGVSPAEYRRRGAATIMESTPAIRTPKPREPFVSSRIAASRWRPLSLTPWLNRRWQGPECWLGDLPLKFHDGKHTICGAHFQLPDRDRGHQAVLLRSERISRSEGRDLPAYFTIPVRKKVAYIYILHACGYVAEPAHIANYEFVLGDNMIDAQPIWTAENRADKPTTEDARSSISDWYLSLHPPISNRHSAPYLAPSAPGDHQTVLYVFRWKNPRPEKLLQEITLRSVPTRVPLAILAVSALQP